MSKYDRRYREKQENVELSELINAVTALLDTATIAADLYANPGVAETCKEDLAKIQSYFVKAAMHFAAPFENLVVPFANTAPDLPEAK